MKNLIALISVCVFLSFSFISSVRINHTNASFSGNIFSPEKENRNFANSLDSAEPDVPPPTGPLYDASNMFNERGFYKSNGFSFDEQEIINDFNGNLMYNIPLYNYKLPGDLVFDVGLTYNGSVGHIFYTGDTSYYKNGTAGRYNMNIPEWIVNINGIGVQVLNFETNFFSNVVQTGVIQGNNVHTLIPAYHYGNLLTDASIPNPDRINILAGDGSVISLMNDARDTSITGYYSYEGKELYYKARVTMIELSGFWKSRNRRVELMKGDGLIFIFEESKIEFSDFSIINGVSPAKRPKVLLLKKIKDKYNNSINLSYTLEHPYQLGSIYGRPLLTSISYDLGFSTSPGNSLYFIYGPQILKIDHTSEINGSYIFKFETPVAFTQADQSITNHRGTIAECKNILGQTNTIKYKNYVRTFSDVIRLDSSGTVSVRLNNLKRMINFKNVLGGRRGYSYFQGDSIGVTLAQYNSNNSLIQSDYYKGYGRDPFYVNMLSSKKDTNETGLPLSRDTLVYNYIDINHDHDVKPVDSTDIYSTIRSKSNLIPGVGWDVSLMNQSKINYYRVYPLYDPAQLEIPDLKDVSGITKLVRENVKTNSSGDTIVNTYTYEHGDLQSGVGYNGSFLINERKTDSYGKIKLSTFQYEYFDEETDDFSQVSSELVKKVVEIDPLNNKTVTDYTYFLYLFNYTLITVPDSGIYYKIQIPNSIKKYRPTNILTYQKSLNYISDTSSSDGYMGQLISEKIYNINNLSDYIETEYEYYKRDTVGKYLYGGDDNFPKKEGNLKLISNPNGQVQKFFYHLTDISETAPLDPNVDFPDYPIFYYRIKYNNGTFKDSTEMIYDRRLPIRIDNYKVTGGSTDTLSRVYKTYTADGSPAKLIDQNRYLTEFKYEPMHRINSITLPGDFSTVPDSVGIKIFRDSLYVTRELKSDSWGIYNSTTGIADYYTEHTMSEFNTCSMFKMDIAYSSSSSSKFAFIKLINDLPQKYLSIDSALLRFWPLKFVADFNGEIPNHDYKTFVNGIDSLGAELNDPCNPPNHWKRKYATMDYFEDSINLPTQSNCQFTERKVDIKKLIQNMSNRYKNLKGITLRSVYTGNPSSPNYPSFYLDMTYCGSGSNTWFNYYPPRINIFGKLDISDTLKFPIIKGGTIKYKYDDDIHTINVYSIRNSLSNIYSQIKYSIDGFGNVKQKDIYTDESSYNSFRYKFNYMNKPSANFDALSDSTNFSYDGLERLIKTRNADTSSTLNSYSYSDSLVYTFGTVKKIIEKQRFTDEEGNLFDKYFDAVGNLRREVKFVDIPIVEFPLNALITDYSYDSLYRVTKVKTPEGKIISYSYDGYGRQSKRITPDAGTTDFIYDKNSNLLYSQDANQRGADIHKYTFRNYDGLNRLTGIGEELFQHDNPYDGIQYAPSTADDYLTVNVYDTISPALISNFFNGVTGYDDGLNFTKGNLAATAYRTRSDDNWSFKYYRYDVRGRVIKMWNIIAGFDTLVTDYYYNSQDQVTFYSHSGKEDVKTFRNTYDYAGRLMKVDYYTGAPDEPDPFYLNLTEYDYNENSQVSQQKFNDGVMKNHLYYSNRNWITLVQNSDGIFEYTNDYFKNGNVKSQGLAGSYSDNFSVKSNLTFDYTYDKSNRLLKSTSSAKSYELENTYDNDGNILTLKRYDSEENLTDNFSYVYASGTNKLRRVTGSTDQYTYDNNGNMTKDDINSNKDIIYDHRNLITRISHNEAGAEGNFLYVTFYNYDEAGNRIAKIVLQFTGSGVPTTLPSPGDGGSGNWIFHNVEFYSRDVSGREVAIYQNNEILEYPLYGLDMIGKLKNDDRYFYYKDHLGSVRVVVNVDNEIVSAQDYDQWGYILQDRTYDSDSSKFKFTSKERDVESQYDYFGARYYDARIGRWGVSDNLFELYIDNSPYQYALNNPINLLDIDGQQLRDDDDDILKAIGALPITGGAISILEASTVVVGGAVAVAAVTGVFLGELTYSAIIDRPSISSPFPISDALEIMETIGITVLTGYEEGVPSYRMLPEIQTVVPGPEKLVLPPPFLTTKGGKQDIFPTIFDPIKSPIIEAIKQGVNRQELLKSAKKWAKEKGLENATEKEFDLLSKYIRDKLKKK